MSPDDLFMRVLPAVARKRAHFFPALAAPACIVVEDRAWTLTLHDDAQPVRAGGDPGAPFQLRLSAPAFAALVDGTFDPAEGSAPGVAYRGDVRVLEQLGRLLFGAVNSVDARSESGAR